MAQKKVSFDVTFLRAIGAGWGSVLSGLVYGVLAFFVRGKSLAALSGRNPRIEGLET